jgi:hypothetical protein
MRTGRLGFAFLQVQGNRNLKNGKRKQKSEIYGVENQKVWVYFVWRSVVKISPKIFFAQNLCHGKSHVSGLPTARHFPIV